MCIVCIVSVRSEMCEINVENSECFCIVVCFLVF